MDPTSFLAAFALRTEPPPKPGPRVAPAVAVTAPAEPGGSLSDRERRELEPLLRDLFPPIYFSTWTRHEGGPKGVTGPLPEVEAPALPPSPPPPAARPRSRPGPKSWALADRFGQTWTHPDKSRLEAWVASRNATPESWTLADRFGQAWTHPDKSYLESWVASRNATPDATGYGLAGACVAGHCPR